MKRGQALPSKYLGQDDFPEPCSATIDGIELEQIEDLENGIVKTKAVLRIKDPSVASVDCERGIIINATNWDMLEEITGESDSDDWVGMEVEIWIDPDVRYGGKKTGGLRIRAVDDAEPAPKKKKAAVKKTTPGSASPAQLKKITAIAYKRADELLEFAEKLDIKLQHDERNGLMGSIKKAAAEFLKLTGAKSLDANFVDPLLEVIDRVQINKDGGVFVESPDVPF